MREEVWLRWIALELSFISSSDNWEN